jgi:hypothetical protein
VISLATIIPIGEKAEKESELLNKTIREYFIKIYKAWGEIFILHEGATTKRFRELFGSPDEYSFHQPYSYISGLLPVYRGEKIAYELRLNEKTRKDLEERIKKELKLGEKARISQIYLLDAKIEEGSSLGESYFTWKDGKFVEMKHYGFELASLYWIKDLDRNSQEDFIRYIFGVHEPGHIHIGIASHFIDTQYGMHCEDENCIMSKPVSTMHGSVDKIRRIKLQNTELFCKKCLEEIKV